MGSDHSSEGSGTRWGSSGYCRKGIDEGAQHPVLTVAQWKRDQQRMLSFFTLCADADSAVRSSPSPVDERTTLRYRSLPKTLLRTSRGKQGYYNSCPER